VEGCAEGCAARWEVSEVYVGCSQSRWRGLPGSSHGSEAYLDHHAAAASQVPLLIIGAGREWAERIRGWDVHELRSRWGAHGVAAAFSPDARYQRFVNAAGDAVTEAAMDPREEVPRRRTGVVWRCHVDEEHSSPRLNSHRQFTQARTRHAGHGGRDETHAHVLTRAMYHSPDCHQQPAPGCRSRRAYALPS
jgi:hypothetical protein